MKVMPLVLKMVTGIVLLMSCSKSVMEENEDEVLLEDSPEIDIINPLEKESINGLVPCEDGFAAGYPCSNFDLLSYIPLEYFESFEANDNWGWTDPETGIEYVLSGLNDGTAFLSIEDPENPIFLGKLPTASKPSIWRDIKVYKNHAFIVSEAQDHGMQVFDLTKLRGLTSRQTFTADAHLTDFKNAHNISINEDSGFAYVVGSNLYEGGPVFIDINDPKNPMVVGGYADASYTHDAQIVNYNGPDENYKGKELFFGSNSDGGANNQVVILDVTNKENPTLVKSINYDNGGYTHQGYLTEDHRYFLLGDELDEHIFGSPTSTRIFDITDLSDPKLHLNYYSTVQAIDHNGYTKGDLFYLASYRAGLRVLDISAIGEKQVSEKGFFDTYPSDNNPEFNGAWNVYPFFESGVIAINDIESGLFLVRASQD